MVGADDRVSQQIANQLSDCSNQLTLDANERDWWRANLYNNRVGTAQPGGTIGGRFTKS
jgi:hypothetical protein